jgi:hypothetical protein
MEQTASAAYPNILVAETLKKAGRPSKNAEELVREGAIAILSFQASDGGFGWWSGGSDPQLWVTAYGVHMLKATSRVVDVDSRPIERAKLWLRARQRDGRWGETGRTHGVAMNSTALTAYVAWALGGDVAAARALEEDLEKTADAYDLALVTLALHSSGRDSALRAAAKLAAVEWTSTQTLTWGRGRCAQAEVTALAVQALLATRAAPERAGKGLEFLEKARRDGDWGSTQATVQSLRALLDASGGGTPGEKATLVFKAGDTSREIRFVVGDHVVPTVDLTEFLGKGPITVTGTAPVSVQAVLKHHEPFKAGTSDFELDVRHPSDWTVGKSVRVGVELRGPTSKMVMAEVGLAPGASPDGASLEQLVASKRVSRYEVRADRVVFYLSALDGPAALDFTVTPRVAAEARVRPSRAYEFYDPDRVAVVPTRVVKVTP